MKQVTISYNPYSVTTEIKVDGENLLIMREADVLGVLEN